jgi:lipopolysaccharide export system permease protein
MVMHVEGLGSHDELTGLRQYWFDEDKTLVRALTADRATYIAGNDSVAGTWLLQNVVETRFDGDKTIRETSLRKNWEGQVDPRVLSVRVLVDPRKLSLFDLSYQIEYMKREGLNPSPYQLAYWSKILQPFAVLGLALIALGFVLGPLREVSMGVRISVGILVGLTFKYLQDLLAPMSIVYDMPPALAVLAPILGCWILGAWGMRRLG